MYNHADEFFFNDTKETNTFGVVFDVKMRLTKYIHKETGKFIRWSMDEKRTLNEEESSQYGLSTYRVACKLGAVVVAESGVFDYTENGQFFGLTSDQMQRALAKRVNE